jgi:hypothetical protein
MKDVCMVSDNSRRVFAGLVTIGMSVGKGGFYGAATYKMGAVLTSKWPQLKDNQAVADVISAFSMVVVGTMFLRTLLVYGAEVWLDFAGRDHALSVQMRHPIFGVGLIQATSMATGFSGYVGASYLMTEYISCDYYDPAVVAVSVLMALCSYVGEYSLAGRAIRSAFERQELPGAVARRLSIGDGDVEYQSLKKTKRQSSIACCAKSALLLFQSLDEAMAMVFLFYKLCKNNSAFPKLLGLALGAVSSMSTFIRTGILYAPRMGLTAENPQESKVQNLSRRSCSYFMAVLLTMSCALAKMFASADGYNDAWIMLQEVLPLGTVDTGVAVVLTASVSLLLLSAFLAEPYLSLSDLFRGVNSVAVNVNCKRMLPQNCVKSDQALSAERNSFLG